MLTATHPADIHSRLASADPEVHRVLHLPQPRRQGALELVEAHQHGPIEDQDPGQPTQGAHGMGLALIGLDGRRCAVS